MKNLFFTVMIGVLLFSCGTEDEPTHKISATASPPEGGTIALSPSDGVYSEGQVVTITGVANEGWIFARWEGDLNSCVNPASIDVSEDFDIVGVFKEGGAGYDDTEDVEFYEQFAAQHGVEMTECGLLYRVIEEGSGEIPAEDQYIFASYKGNSIDGFMQFEVDPDVFLPIEFRQFFATQFRGLTEAVLMMSPGATFELVLPTNLARFDGRYFYFELQMDSFLEYPDVFLSDNAENEGVFVTQSGLQYRIIEEGNGPKPSANSQVQVRYKGYYTNGHIFDESNNAELNLSNTIQGFTEGLQLMSVGSTFELFLPADIAYGDNPPTGSGIIPGAIMVFEVELLDIVGG